MASEAELARAAAEKLGLRLPATDEGVVKLVLLNALDALERARVVGVLDAWAAKTGESASHDTCRKPIGTWWCTLWQGHEGDDDAQHFKADTADAARAAAAKAIEAGEV